MTNDPSNSEMNVTPESPSITPKPGWQTSQGQMTAIFTLVCLALSLLGYHYTPEQFQDWVDRLEHLASVILPLISAIVPLVTYIISRGKLYSNAMKATAQVQVAANTPTTIPGTLSETLFSPGIGEMVGGTSWKDPDRYGNLLHIASELGVPGVGAVDKLNQQMHPADLITGILGMLKNRAKK